MISQKALNCNLILTQENQSFYHEHEQSSKDKRDDDLANEIN